jgi:hypothetical protein
MHIYNKLLIKMFGMNKNPYTEAAIFCFNQSSAKESVA